MLLHFQIHHTKSSGRWLNLFHHTALTALSEKKELDCLSPSFQNLPKSQLQYQTYNWKIANIRSLISTLGTMLLKHISLLSLFYKERNNLFILNNLATTTKNTDKCLVNIL